MKLSSYRTDMGAAGASELVLARLYLVGSDCLRLREAVSRKLTFWSCLSSSSYFFIFDVLLQETL